MEEKDKQIEDEVLRDYTRDVRNYMANLKSIILILCTVLVVVLAGFIAVVINNQRMMKDIANHSADLIVEALTEYEWNTEYEIATTDNELYSGNITLGK